MKTRVHIHRENVPGSGGLKHFIVMLPFDVENVEAIKISVIAAKASGKGGHFEAGTLRITRDGLLLYEKQVQIEDRNAGFADQFMQLGIEENFKPVSGTKQIYETVNFPGEPRALFCKYTGNKMGAGSSYTLVLYFIYSKKSKR